MKGHSICDHNINRASGGKPVPLEATAVIFRGDRYIARQDQKHGFIVQETAPSDSWFNIACVKTTLSKLHLQRHTLAASDAQHQTTVAQRQTLLKLLAGDYCGSGKSFTHNGVPLRYKYTQAAWQPTVYPYRPDDIASIDAIWKEDGSGARCVGKPRLSLYPKLEDEAFPGPRQGPLKQRIQKECQRVQHEIPDCPKSTDVTLSPPDYAVSGNPK